MGRLGGGVPAVATAVVGTAMGGWVAALGDTVEMWVALAT